MACYLNQKHGVEGDLLLILKNYLKNRKQRVVLNGQTFEWRKINSGVPKGSALGPLLNDLLDGITLICKIFANDTSLFLKAQDINKSANELNCELEKVSNLAYQWKIQFIPNP